ncbi:hypothetical protein HHI36_016715 [Cryptolaemus montrouzieri]|uniref:Uncharacterized protein n=1 Tax=Cryptolaemus montrouzieri TaxID=559131 RepID=A0ABD2NKH5_9CUCU
MTEIQTEQNFVEEIASCELDIQTVINNQTQLRIVLELTNNKIADNALNSGNQTDHPSDRNIKILNHGETLDRLHRSHNVLLRGVPETAPDGDATTVKELLCSMDSNAGDQCLNIHRVGNTGARSRPLKVSFSNPLIASKTLCSKTVIVNYPVWNSYSISDDKTPQQL